MGKYFISRARIVTKIAKYPHVDDYRYFKREKLKNTNIDILRRAIADTDEVFDDFQGKW